MKKEVDLRIINFKKYNVPVAAFRYIVKVD